MSVLSKTLTPSAAAFGADEAGAVTTSWVVMAALAIGLGLGATALVGGGMAGSSGDIVTALDGMVPPGDGEPPLPHLEPTPSGAEPAPAPAPAEPEPDPEPAPYDPQAAVAAFEPLTMSAKDVRYNYERYVNRDSDEVMRNRYDIEMRRKNDPNFVWTDVRRDHHELIVIGARARGIAS